MTTLRRFALAALAALSMAACSAPFQSTTPPGFVEIEDDHDDYDYRATTADGLVLAVRAIDHDPVGEPSFWLEAIKNRIRDRGGYAVLEEVPVTSADGVPGTQIRFGHDENGNRPHLYYVTVFVTDAHIFLLEAGGTKDQMLAKAVDIDEHVKRFRAR